MNMVPEYVKMEYFQPGLKLMSSQNAVFAL